MCYFVYVSLLPVFEVIVKSCVYACVYTASDYCQWDTFHASCLRHNEVVVMKSAIYGRMSSGRCIERDYGYVGCHSDVLQQADARCSGRRECKFEIPYQAFDVGHPCPKDLTRFLRASFICVNVFLPGRQDCVSGRPVPVPGSSGHLASLATGETGCGATDTAWLIDAGPGQTIVISLLDFSVSSNSSSRTTHRHRTRAKTKSGGLCHEVYATVKELVTGRIDTICASRTRVTEVYRCRDTPLEIRTLPGSGLRTRYFLLKYQVLGCADLESAPSGATISRHGNTTVIRCVTSSLTWSLVCVGAQWTGPSQHCPATVDLKSGVIPIANNSLMIITTIAAVFGVLIFLVGLICFKRYYSRRSSDSAQRSGRDVASERRGSRDVYATTPCVVKDATGGTAILPPYELHFQTSATPGWPSSGCHGHQQGRRRVPDAEHDYESMEEDDQRYLGGTDHGYVGGGLADAAGTRGYQTVGMETSLRPGGNGYAATVVSVPSSLHVTRHCSYPPTTFN